jgi:hypothetical protein
MRRPPGLLTPVVLTVVLVVLLTGCGQPGGPVQVGSASTPTGGDDSLTVPYGGEWPASGPADPHPPAEAARDTMALGDVEAATSAGVAEAAPLRAGSVDDNDRFLDYLDYRARFLATGIPVHDRDVSERHVVRVTTPDGHPVLGARVSLHAADRELAVVRTHADGRALLHPLLTAAPGAETYVIRVEHGEVSGSVDVPDRSQRDHPVVLDAPRPDGSTRLDVHFLIDATGSMADEIERLKSSMVSIAGQIAALPTRPDVRWGMTAYRDRGDDFVTRSFDFTSDLATFTAELANLHADGGGDPPEALNEALHAAVNGPGWDVGNAVQLMFLVADAPPHLDYPDDADYAEEMLVAAEKGITIVPIASSGLDDQGEYIFRQLAQVTLGRFLFLTYGPDGQPGDGTTHDVHGYEVRSLDELVVAYVSEQLAHREPRPAQQPAAQRPALP